MPVGQNIKRNDVDRHIWRDEREPAIIACARAVRSQQG